MEESLEDKVENLDSLIQDLVWRVKDLESIIEYQKDQINWLNNNSNKSDYDYYD